jgi:DNA-binding transcriptional regulator YiaG
MNALPTMAAAEIDRIRAELKVSQREMAALLGVDLRTYQRWAAGHRKIPGPVVLLVKRIMHDHENVIA